MTPVKAFVLSLSALLALAFLGCNNNDGGDSTGSSTGDLALEAYFQRIDEVFEDTERLAESFQADFSIYDPGLSIEEQRGLMRDYFDGALPVVEQFVASLEAIDPPAEVSDEHRAFVAVYQGALSNARNAVDGIDVASVEDLAGALSDFVSDLMAGAPACADLQAVAGDNEIETRLGC